MNRYYEHRHGVFRVALIAMVSMLLAIVTGCGASPRASESATSPAAMQDSRPVESANGAAAPDTDGAFSAELPETARKVIANASENLVVEDTQTAVDEITSAVEAVGGYVSSANLYRDSFGGRNLLRGSLSLRVPADQLEPIMAQLEALALEVQSKSVDRQDVTDQYSDIEAQLRNLEATEVELRELLAEVRNRPNASSEDILAVHRDLTNIRGQIEQLQGRKNMMDDLIALSTLDVTLIPDEANRPVVEDRWEPGNAVRSATRQLVNTFQFFGNAAIWILVYLLPILLVLLIPLIILVLLVRWLVKRRQKRLPVSTVEAGDEAGDESA